MRAQGTNDEIYQRVKERCGMCLDLLARLVDARGGNHAEPCFHKLVLDVYALFGNGNIAERYLGTPPDSPRPGDEAHARMLLEELRLTCYAFNPNTDKCRYIEDLIYCKRHTPILSVQKLIRMCTKYERAKKRKHPEAASVSITHIKNAILAHESNLASCRGKDSVCKDLALRKRFNAWLRKIPH
jgi:hypothetical protein